MAQRPRRSRPLVVRYGDAETILWPSDVDLLIEAATKLAAGMWHAHDRRDTDERVQAHLAKLLENHSSELDALTDDLVHACPSPRDPPLEITPERSRLLRQVMSDLTGYQRGDLTPALRELRKVLSA